MKVTRRGARADNGPSSIELTSPRFSLDKDGVVIQDQDIKDFSTKAHYNYRMILSLDEVGNIIDALGSCPEEKRQEIGKALESKIKNLLRITQYCMDA